MEESSRGQRFSSILALSGLLAGLLVWLWPIGVGGKMPVGGDVTQFSLGLMAVVQRAYASWRLPVWNSLWGYGYPGLAESQMGVFYPPHWLFYGTLPLETAYTALLVFHTLWGGLGTFWAARRFEVSALGAALAGFAWAASGFFLIHIPHQWAYTVGSWMPWAIGLAWSLGGQGRSTSRLWLLLVLVFAIQVLPGHFQLAFCTQVATILLSLGGLTRSKESRRRLVLVLLAILASLPLAALQLWPTFRLAQLAEGRRDFEYLSGFAVSPLHLISYLAPGLFHQSPLWRPLAWDPFHTSPEEYLGYVGLIPLFLAGKMVISDFRRDSATRALAILGLGTLFLSLGPYAPGFSLWMRLPGFSFFRGPARWTLATELALCLLAGRGFDACRSWSRVGVALGKFAGGSLAVIGLLILAIELALAGADSPAIASGFQRGLNLLPWSSIDKAPSSESTTNPRVTREPTFRELVVVAKRPQNDSRIPTALARQGFGLGRPSDWKFSERRFAIYRQELVITAGLLVGMVFLSVFVRHEKRLLGGFLLLTLLDLWVWGHQRPFDLGPIRPLQEQSQILRRLATESPGGRILDSSRNLPMVVGTAPVSAYRTLDLPILEGLTEWAQRPIGVRAIDDETVEAIRAVGASVRVLEPAQTAVAPAVDSRLPHWDQREIVVDPVLAGWLSGADVVKLQGRQAATFTLWRPNQVPAEAWFIRDVGAGSESMLKSWSAEPREVLAKLKQAEPLRLRRVSPEYLEIEVGERTQGTVVISQLADPQWRARWVGPQESHDAKILPVFRQKGGLGWQAVVVPGPGPWKLELTYAAADVRQGLWGSSIAGIAWILTFLGSGRRKVRNVGANQ